MGVVGGGMCVRCVCGISVKRIVLPLNLEDVYIFFTILALPVISLLVLFEGGSRHVSLGLNWKSMDCI